MATMYNYNENILYIKYGAHYLYMLRSYLLLLQVTNTNNYSEYALRNTIYLTW